MNIIANKNKWEEGVSARQPKYEILSKLLADFLYCGNIGPIKRLIIYSLCTYCFYLFMEKSLISGKLLVHFMQLLC